MTAVYALVVALGLIVVLLGLLVVGLLRSHAEILRRLDRAGAGLSDAHGQESTISMTARNHRPSRSFRDITGVTPDGEPVVLSTAAGGDPTLIAFLSTTCSSCASFWENFDSSSRYFGGRRHRILIVTLGETEESPSRALSLARGDADVVMSTTAWNDFGVPGAPYFALVDSPTGEVIGEGSASTFTALEEFLEDASNDRQWDRDRSAAHDEESRIDQELRDAGLSPGDPRLYPDKGDIAEDDSS